MSALISDKITSKILLDQSCNKIIVQASYLKKYFINALDTNNINECKYYSLKAKIFSGSMLLKSAKCDCISNQMEKIYSYTEKAENQSNLSDCKKSTNKAISLLDQSVKSITVCETN